MEGETLTPEALEAAKQWCREHPLPKIDYSLTMPGSDRAWFRRLASFHADILGRYGLPRRFFPRRH